MCLARARTSEPAAVRDQVFDKKSKAGRKRVANPHELIENLAANVVENQVFIAAGYNNGMRPYGNTNMQSKDAAVDSIDCILPSTLLPNIMTSSFALSGITAL